MNTNIPKQLKMHRLAYSFAVLICHASSLGSSSLNLHPHNMQGSSLMAGKAGKRARHSLPSSSLTSGKMFSGPSRYERRKQPERSKGICIVDTGDTKQFLEHPEETSCSRKSTRSSGISGSSNGHCRTSLACSHWTDEHGMHLTELSRCLNSTPILVASCIETPIKLSFIWMPNRLVVL